MKLTEIPNNTKLRLDTTVGTRVFAGDTMIYGDTGWRETYSYTQDPDTWSAGWIKIRRTGNQVSLAVGLTCTAGTGQAVAEDVIPNGFWPTRSSQSGIRTAAGLVGLNTGHSLFQVAVYGQSFYYRGPVGTTTATYNRIAQPFRGIMEWTTDSSWPTTLPGTPGLT